MSAPLPILAAPLAVAQWIHACCSGNAPKCGKPTTPRRPTTPTEPTAAALKFERELLSYHERPQDREDSITPRREPAPPQRIDLRWDAPMVHRCVGCPPDQGEREWTRARSSHISRVAMSARPAIGYTGWCERCMPESQQFLSSKDNALRDARLMQAHEDGDLPGSLLLSPRDKMLCPVCLEPWLVFPGLGLPIDVGALDEIDIVLHPCPWCWVKNEKAAREAQEFALNHAW